MKDVVSFVTVFVASGLALLARLWWTNRPSRSIAQVLNDVEGEPAPARVRR